MAFSPIVPPVGCSCSDPSPPFIPKFESLSDDDLDVIELIYWMIYSEEPIPETLSPTYEQVQTMLSYCDCWRCVSPRRRREMLIAKMVDFTGCFTEAEARSLIEAIERNSTRDQRVAALDCARYAAIETVNCQR